MYEDFKLFMCWILVCSAVRTFPHTEWITLCCLAVANGNRQQQLYLYGVDGRRKRAISKFEVQLDIRKNLVQFFEIFFPTQQKENRQISPQGFELPDLDF